MDRGTRRRSKNPRSGARAKLWTARASGFEHLGRQRHRGDDRQDEEGHDGGMVQRGLALIGHGGIPVRGDLISQVGEEAGMLPHPPAKASSQPAQEGHRDAGHHHGQAHHGQHDRDRRLPGGFSEVDGRELGLEFGEGREVVDELGDALEFSRTEPGTRAVPRPFTDA